MLIAVRPTLAKIAVRSAGFSTSIEGANHRYRYCRWGMSSKRLREPICRHVGDFFQFSLSLEEVPRPLDDV